MDLKLLERQYAEAQALFLSEDAYRRWAIANSGHRFMAWKGKTVVAYQLVLGGPVVQDELTLDSFSVDAIQGLSTNWASQKHGQLLVTQHPTEIAEGCFMWHNQHSTLEYVSHHNRYSLRVAMSWRTYRNPKTLDEGITYLLEKAAFDDFDWTAK